MPSNLSSVEAKIGRAEQHLKAIHNEVAIRLQPHLYSVTSQLNADATCLSWIFHASDKGTDFEALSVLVGDYIHNLRCALDHLVYAIAIYESRQDPPPEANKLAFPLACNAAQFHDAKRRIKSLSDPVRAIIEAVQPYNRPHPELPPLLGLLGELDDIDKHRLLQVVIGAFKKASFGYSNLPPGTAITWRIRSKPPEDGAEIAAIIFGTPQPDVKGNFVGDWIIIVPHRPGMNKAPGTEIIDLLHMLRDEVKAVVIRVAAAV